MGQETMLQRSDVSGLLLIPDQHCSLVPVRGRVKLPCKDLRKNIVAYTTTRAPNCLPTSPSYESGAGKTAQS